MKFILEISLNNAAYRDYAPYPEQGELNTEALASDLKYIADQIRDGSTSKAVIDINGNKVGQWRIIND